jgi:CHAT domain-containing protein/tetratricopeptide (TPR) repeat protein
MRLLICTLFLCTATITLPGQCPDRDSLWNRILVLQEADPATRADQLKELLSCEKKVIHSRCPVDSVYTALLMRISALYYLQADFASAISYSTKAIQLLHQNAYSPAIRKQDIAKSFYYLTIFYDSLKMIRQKEDAADSCILHEKKIGSDYRYSCFLMAFKVKELFFKGEYNLCAEYAALGELLTRKYYKARDSMDHIILFITYYTNSLNLLKRFPEAEAFLQSKKAQFLAGHNKKYLAIIYNFLGYVSKIRGDYRQAAGNFEKAFRFDVQTETKDVATEALCQLGLIYTTQLHQLKQGLFYFHKALFYAKDFNFFYVSGTMAKVFGNENMFDSAYHYFQQAFYSIQPGINENDLLLHIEYVYANSAEYVLNIILDKGDTYLRQYTLNHQPSALEQALKTYRTVDKLLDSIKSGQPEIKSRLFWRTYTRRLYEHAISACYLVSNTQDAFYFFEKSRAVVLNDQLTEERWARGDEFLQLAQARKNILELNREMSGTSPASQEYAAIREEQYAKKRDLARLEDVIKNRYKRSNIGPAFAGLKTFSMSLETGNQYMLEIFSGDSSMFTLFITPQKTIFSKIEKPAFDEAVDSFIMCIRDPEVLNNNFLKFRHASAKLYQLLFQNIPMPAGRMIVSPDGQYFPFECLISDNTGASPIYFLQEHAISYTYSARYLQDDFTGTSATIPKNFMGVAPLNFSQQLHLSALAGSDVSLQTISNYFSGADVLILDEATKDRFQRQFPAYKIIQLYTHASDSSMRKEPVIYFSDSALYLSELIPEKKPATQLIVLSACETGKGTLYQGEGVFSFNRAFAALGVPSSITNLWSIDNVSTYKLTELFYKYLSLGLPLDIALQKAKLEYIRNAHGENQLPYYWAAPILVGKTEPILLQQGFSWKYILVGIAICGLLIVAWKKIKQSKTFNPVQDTVQTGP